MNKIGIISTFPPTQCGIATYTTDLYSAIQKHEPELQIIKFRLAFNKSEESNSDYIIRNNSPEDFHHIAEIINTLDLDLIDIQHEYKIFGKPDGENIEILLDKINKPIVTTLHTINNTLSINREHAFKKLVERSNLLFVFSNEAREIINTKYGGENGQIDHPISG